jgi:hypothetical protein
MVAAVRRVGGRLVLHIMRYSAFSTEVGLGFQSYGQTGIGHGAPESLPIFPLLQRAAPDGRNARGGDPKMARM